MSANKIMIVAAISALVSGSVAASPLFIEKPREEMPELVMPKSQFSSMRQEAIADSEPRTRQTIGDALKSYQGFEWKNTEDGARQHLLYSRGAYVLSKAQKEALKDYARDLPSQSQVVVAGYADEEGSPAKNSELAQNRAQQVANYLSSQRTDLEIITFHSVLWPGDPADARRTEVLQIVQRTLKSDR